MQIRDPEPLNLTVEQYINHVIRLINNDLKHLRRNVSNIEVTGMGEEIVKALKIVVEQSGFIVTDIIDGPVKFNKNFKDSNKDPEWVDMSTPRLFLQIRKKEEEDGLRALNS